MGISLGRLAENRAGTQNQSRRDEWVKRALERLPSGCRVLDAGAGEQRYKRFCSHLVYVSQDFAQYDGQGNGVGLQNAAWDHGRLDIISDITRIPEPDASFDAVICTEVLEHVPDPIGALRELIRLLRSGGTLILTAPFCALTHQAPYFYHTGYSRYFYGYWLPELGCEVVEMDWNGNYFHYMAQEHRRLAYVAGRYTGRRLRWYERLAGRVILAALARFSRHDSGSHELLSYGLHVLARKTA